MTASTPSTKNKSSVCPLLSYVLDKAPRSRSKRQRRYENVDISKDFELRYKRREAEKQAKLEELYEKHDKKALEFKGIVSLGKTSTPQGDLSED